MFSNKDLRGLVARHDRLLDERSSWEEDWRTLARYFLPRKCRILEAGDSTNEGGLRGGALDSTGVYAMRDLAAGLHGGMTSPARPWFRLSLYDSDLANSEAVRRWLNEVQKRMRSLLHRSNFYNAVHHVYSELGTFGTAFIFALDDHQGGVRYYPLTAGEYCLDANEHGRVDTVYRNMDMTLRQLVRRFGLENLPESLRRQWEKPMNWNERHKVVHAVFPREDNGGPGAVSRRKPFASVYYLEGTSSGGRSGASLYTGSGGAPFLLAEGGFDEMPGFGPRWDTTGNDVYGRSPGMDVLPDCVLLQSMTASMLKALHKEVDPPMVAPAHLKQINLLPGGANYVDAGQGQGQQIYPAMQIRHNVEGTSRAVAKIQEQVREGLFNNLFRMLLNSDRRQITAKEVAVREEEKLILIGPVLERLHDELLTPLITRTFNILMATGQAPPPPPELDASGLKVEFVSLLAQAQKMVSTGAIEQYVSFLGQVGRHDPSILDAVDTDKLADAYGDYLGVDTDIIRSQEEREKRRNERNQQGQLQQMMGSLGGLLGQGAAGGQAGAGAPDISALLGQVGGGGGDLSALLGQLGGGGASGSGAEASTGAPPGLTAGQSGGSSISS